MAELQQGHGNPAFDSDLAIQEEPTNGNVANHEKAVDKSAHADVESQSNDKSEKHDFDLLYRLNDNPSWYLCLVLGLQHCFLAVGGSIGIPLILGPAMCMDSEVGFLGRAMILNTLLFMGGIFTFLQTTFGTRLPIMQGPSYIFILPIFAVLNLPHNQCPSGPINPNVTNGSFLYNDTDGAIVDGNELWQRRMREIQGSIAVAATVEIVLAVTGGIGFMMRFIGPLTIAPAIFLLGISLFGAATSSSSTQWGVAVFTIFTIILFSQFLRNVKLPFPMYSRSSKGCHISKTNFFQLFSVVIAIVLAWLLCLILTVTGALPDNPAQPAYRARTDAKLSVLYSSPWFRFPYPGQWGLPVVTGAGVVGMIAGFVASMIESIGDYYACARLSGAPPVPKHAVNRGLAMEGLGSLVAGLVGTGPALTSYSQNVGAIALTRVASRRVLQVAGLLFFLLGMLGKFGAVLVLIPDPVIGGLMCVLFAMIAAVGISNLQHVDLNSSRNLFVLGFSIFMGIAVPLWVAENRGAINTGVQALDQIFLVLLETSILVGGVLGAVLDNVLPGTREERGMISWNKYESNESGKDISGESKTTYTETLAECYNLPFSTNTRFSRYIPILPEFGKTSNSTQ